jgi:hypothetical protein
MLTPYGLLQNLVLNETYLTPYYAKIQTPPPINNAVFFYTFLALHLGLCLGIYFFLKRNSRTRDLR